MNDLVVITIFCLGYALTMILYLGIVTGVLKRRWQALAVQAPRGPRKRF